MNDPIVFSGRHRVAVACGATLGETPMWDPRIGTLYWVDIKQRNLWRWRPDGGEAVRRGFDTSVAFVKLTPDPEVVIIGLGLALVRHHLGRDTSETVLRLDAERPGNRLNDAGVGPDGSLYLGTMDDAETEATGSFYRWSAAGLERFGERAVVTNGPTVDGVRRVVYTADTQAGRVFRHALGPNGVPGGPQPFVTFAPGWGHPDGLTVDAEGHVWICHWGGARVTRFSPAGEPVRRCT